jgi:hypothetical protein
MRFSRSPSAKTLEAVDKLASYMKAKAAKNPPEPKEPKGSRVRSDDGRFAGVRVNEEGVPRLPIFPAQWALDDPRQRPYLVVWGTSAYALKMAVSEGGKAVVVTLTGSQRPNASPTPWTRAGRRGSKRHLSPNTPATEKSPTRPVPP